MKRIMVVMTTALGLTACESKEYKLCVQLNTAGLKETCASMTTDQMTKAIFGVPEDWTAETCEKAIMDKITAECRRNVQYSIENIYGSNKGV